MFVAFLGWWVHDEELEEEKENTTRREKNEFSSGFGERTNERTNDRPTEKKGRIGFASCEGTHGVVGKRDIVRPRRRFRFPRDGILGGDSSKTEVSRGS